MSVCDCGRCGPTSEPSLPSWPFDGQPRFKLSSVSGYPGSETWSEGKYATIWSVLDRAACHAVVMTTNNGASAVKVCGELNRNDGDSRHLRKLIGQRASYHRRKAQYGQRP